MTSSSQDQSLRFQRYAEAHANRNGVDDARPTALQIVQDENMVGKLTDKVIMITGAAAGIGVETARALHATGATLYLPVRNVEKGEKVKSDILSTSKGSGEIFIMDMDLASQASVRACASSFLKQSQKLNILINNAGIMSNPTREISTDGQEMQFQVCHLSHFLLFQLLKPTLLASATPEFPSRVVCLASSGHRGGGVVFEDVTFSKEGSYSGGRAYAQAKTANIHMANQIERLYGSQNLHANSLHPGGIATNLQKHWSQAARDSFTKDDFVRKIMKSPAQGCATTVWAAIGSEWAHKGGKYLENEQVSPPFVEGSHPGEAGYAPHAYDPEAEEKLWALSCELVQAD